MNPRLRGWLLLLAAVLAEVTGSISMKAALDDPRLYTITGIAYAGAFVLLSGVLRLGVPLGVAYGTWAAAGVALTAIGSAVLFGEPFTPLMGMGIVLITAGVLLVELGSSHTRRARDTVEL